MNEKYGVYASPIGEIHIVWNDEGIIKLELFKEIWDVYHKEHKEVIREENSSIFVEVIQQLKEYFEGKRIKFELPICIKGTEFQKQVWKALLEIPYGETQCYLDIANKIGKPKAVRAIGQANRINSLPIIIPCHRVIGKNGDMVGYAGANIDIKIKLLQLEKKMMSKLKNV